MGLFDTDVSRETSERLTLYGQLLRKWNPKINLVAPSTLEDTEERHLRDSAQIFDFLPKTAMSLADFGSGGGFPGMVLAILAKEKRPDMKVTMVESDQRKCSFLRTVLRETGVSAHVVSNRIENIAPLQSEVNTARALSNLSTLLSFAKQHQTSNGTCFFLKGRTWKSEVEEAENQWKFSYTPHKSITDPHAVILEIRDISHD